MKHILIFSISIYQKFISSLLKNIFGGSDICRFSPTCSEYTKQMIKNKGVYKGIYLGTVRLLHCHPFINKENAVI